MTNAEFFTQRFEGEQPAFRKVLAALPADKLDYKPHEKNTPAGALAWQLVLEQKGIANILKSGKDDFVFSPPPALDAILAEWDRATEEVREALKSADDAKWDGEAQFLMNGNPVWTDTLRGMLWGFLFDMVHHRGQLSAYLRPMGGKVPAIYGPSADEQA
ncbi:MAG TPA: DinB family protein [Thermoanaerobaculia bacterium]|nr:DinB family protein [Thermoanaerobaculia bacterium]